MRSAVTERIGTVNTSKPCRSPQSRGENHPSAGISDLLKQAVDTCVLLELILEFFPTASSPKGCYTKIDRARVCAVWRNEKMPSVDLSFLRGRWLWVDRGTGQGGDAFTFLTEVAGLSRKEAAQYLIARAGLQDESPKRTGTSEERARAGLERDFRTAHPSADPGFLAEFAERRLLGLEPPPNHDSLAYMAFGEVGGAGLSAFGVLLELQRGCGPDERALRGQIDSCIKSVLADWICEAIGPYLQAEEGGEVHDD